MIRGSCRPSHLSGLIVRLFCAASCVSLELMHCEFPLYMCFRGVLSGGVRRPSLSPRTSHGSLGTLALKTVLWSLLGPNLSYVVSMHAQCSGHSNELAKSRLQILKAREAGMQKIIEKAKLKLDEISQVRMSTLSLLVDPLFLCFGIDAQTTSSIQILLFIVGRWLQGPPRQAHCPGSAFCPCSLFLVRDMARHGESALLLVLWFRFPSS